MPREPLERQFDATVDRQDVSYYGKTYTIVYEPCMTASERLEHYGKFIGTIRAMSRVRSVVKNTIAQIAKGVLDATTQHLRDERVKHAGKKVKHTKIPVVAFDDDDVELCDYCSLNSLSI